MYPKSLLALFLLLVPLFASATNSQHELARELRNHTLVIQVAEESHPFYDALANAAADEWSFSDLAYHHGRLNERTQLKSRRAYLLINENKFSPRSGKTYAQAELMVYSKQEKQHVLLARAS